MGKVSSSSQSPASSDSAGSSSLRQGRTGRHTFKSKKRDHSSVSISNSSHSTPKLARRVATDAAFTLSIDNKNFQTKTELESSELVVDFEKNALKLPLNQNAAKALLARLQKIPKRFWNRPLVAWSERLLQRSFPQKCNEIETWLVCAKEAEQRSTRLNELIQALMLVQRFEKNAKKITTLSQFLTMLILDLAHIPQAFQGGSLAILGIEIFKIHHSQRQDAFKAWLPVVEGSEEGNRPELLNDFLKSRERGIRELNVSLSKHAEQLTLECGVSPEEVAQEYDISYPYLRHLLDKKRVDELAGDNAQEVAQKYNITDWRLLGQFAI
jgi:hypothetical protein